MHSAPRQSVPHLVSPLGGLVHSIGENFAAAKKDGPFLVIRRLELLLKVSPGIYCWYCRLVVFSF